jgi:CheY-like chemotaxis protein
LARRVLVVDDEESVCRLIERSLRFAGIEAVSAPNGTEALQVLRRDKQIALVLLDLMMPHMDGYAFRHAQRLDPALAGIPVVVVTGGALVVDSARAARRGRLPGETVRARAARRDRAASSARHRRRLVTPVVEQSESYAVGVRTQTVWDRSRSSPQWVGFAVIRRIARFRSRRFREAESPIH